MNLKTRVDPELLPSLDGTIGVLGFDFMGTLDAPKRRARFDEFLRQVLPGTRAFPEVHRRDQKIPGYGGGPEVSVRTYRPPDQPTQSAGVLFIHGGGFNIGSVEQEDAPAAALALNLRCSVVSVDYRLAPEHPHPAPVNDCYAALKWMATHAADLGLDRERIAVYGHSAGGGLAATLAQMARDQRGPGIAYQMLCYPMLDDRMDSPAFSRLSGLGVWDLGANATAWRALLGGHGEKVSDAAPYAVAARANNLAALPAAYIDVGDLDILIDQGIDYGRRLMDAGVAVELHIYPGAYHGFDAFAPQASVSRRAVQSRLGSLRRALSLGA